MQPTFYCCYIVGVVQHTKAYLDPVDRPDLDFFFVIYILKK